MRVISGRAKGKKLKSVVGDTTRPITDRSKEALFNIIGNDIYDTKFLDCFGGTGSVGIEALSRGASFARFIEQSPAAIEVIIENLKITGLSKQAQILRGDAFKLMSKKPDIDFNYIYIAPPQYQELWSKMLLLIDKNIQWTNDETWVIVQIHPKEYRKMDEELKNLQEFDQRKYGSTMLVFYWRYNF